MLKKIIIIGMGILAINSHAYLVTSFQSTTIDFNQPTRILVAGAGDDLGSQFQFVAKAKALKYRELYPNDQIVLITKEETDLGNNTVILKNLGFELLKNNKSTFNGEAFVDELLNFKAISSLDIFSHSSAQYGVHLDGKAHRLTLNTKNLEKIKGKFLKGAYAFIHGCNTGFNLAPFLSEKWGIPVAGSMTSTNFQKLHADGNFYQTEEGKFPNADWASSNSISYSKEVNCKEGGCLRLKPDNHPYVGYWGEYYEGGLPFYKFFCATNSDVECKMAMGKALLSFISVKKITPNSSFEEYKKVVVDFLCPISASRDLRGECENNLDQSLKNEEMTYNPFSRPLVQCDLKGCEVEISCKKIPLIGVYKPGTCKLENKFVGKATTMVQEYKYYLEAFQYLSL